MAIHESAEMYLETILILKNRIGQVRAIDIAREMEFSRPTVSIGLKNLRNSGFLEVTPTGAINLTEKGQLLATEIYEKHTVISEMLIKLGVDKGHAYADACKIEHVISKETFESLKQHLTFFKNSQLPV